MANIDWDAIVDQQDADFLGDPRHCPYHPGVKTSSDDGMFDAPCGECEAAMNEGER